MEQRLFLSRKSGARAAAIRPAKRILIADMVSSGKNNLADAHMGLTSPAQEKSGEFPLQLKPHPARPR